MENKVAKISIQLDEDMLGIWRPYINKGSLTISDLKGMMSFVNAKNIFDWQKDGLLSCERKDSVAGWRRFSMLNALRFRIAAGCRDIGLSIARTKKVVKHISESTIDVLVASKETKSKRVSNLPALECVIVASLSRKKLMLLLYDFDSGGAFIGNQIDIIERYFNTLKESKPAILLPLFNYVLDIATILAKEAKNDKMIQEFVKSCNSKT